MRWRWLIRVQCAQINREHNYFFRKFFKYDALHPIVVCVDVMSHDCRSILSNNYTLPFPIIPQPSDRESMSAHKHFCHVVSLLEMTKNSNNKQCLTRTKQVANRQKQRQQFNEYDQCICEIAHIWYDSRWYFSLKYSCARNFKFYLFLLSLSLTHKPTFKRDSTTRFS